MGYFAIDTSPDLKHYGILGMKWGVRRYENADGTLTAEGRRRYSHMYGNRNTSATTKRVMNDWQKMNSKDFRSKYHVSKDTYSRRAKKYNDPSKEAPLAKIGRRLNKMTPEQRKALNIALGIGATTAVTGAVIGGMALYNKYGKRNKVDGVIDKSTIRTAIKRKYSRPSSTINTVPNAVETVKRKVKSPLAKKSFSAKQLSGSTFKVRGYKPNSYYNNRAKNLIKKRSLYDYSAHTTNKDAGIKRMTNDINTLRKTNRMATNSTMRQVRIARQGIYDSVPGSNQWGIYRLQENIDRVNLLARRHKRGLR